ncbi:MAG: hypothetical protein L6R39_003188 [Caloplaca ligustica]|nr:MAG: hypothetical protein L6R39_003188 [Caloplaca ligustica]
MALGPPGKTSAFVSWIILRPFAPSFDKLWFDRPGGYAAPYHVPLPSPSSASGSASPTRSPSRGWDDLSKVGPVTPPLSLTTCEELPVVRDAVGEKQPILTEPHVAKHASPSDPIPPRPSAIEVRGVDDEFQHPIDLYQPAIKEFHEAGPSDSSHRLGGLRHPRVIEPVDTVTTWKRLTPVDCDALLFIQKHVKVGLEQLLEKQFISFKTRLRSAARSIQQESRAMSDCVETVIPCRFRFERAPLVHAVSHALMMPADSNDLGNRRYSIELLMLYLWSRDCLIDLPDQPGYTVMNARYRCLLDAGAYCPSSNTVEALCTPDHIFFEGLDVLPQEGSEIVIKPHYHANASRGPGDPFTLVTYSIESDHPWLHWYDDAQAFQGQVPQYSQSPSVNSGLGQACPLGRQGSHTTVHNVTIEVKASITASYRGSGVCLERTVRVRVTLRVLPPAIHPSQAQVLARAQSCVPLQVQDHQPVGEPQRIRRAADTVAAITTTVVREDNVAPTDPTTLRIGAAASVGPSTKWASFGAPPSSTDSGDSNVPPTKREAGITRGPNNYPPPANGYKQRSSARTLLSNIPGIELEALALIQTNSNDPVLRESAPCSTDGAGESEGWIASKEPYYEEAEAFEVQRTRRRSEKNSERLWVRATASPKDKRSENQRPQTSTPRTRRPQRNVRGHDRPRTPFRTHGSSPDAYRFDIQTTSACKRKIRSAQDLHSSLKRRQDHSSKISSLDEEAMHIQNPGGKECVHRSTQESIARWSATKQAFETNCCRIPWLGVFSPGKEPALGEVADASSRSPVTPIGKSKQTLPESTAVSGAPQTPTFSNRFGPLEDMSQASNGQPSSNSGDSELVLSAGAQGLFWQDKRPRRGDRRVDSACYLEDVFRDAAQTSASPSRQGSAGTAPGEGSSATSRSQNNEGYKSPHFDAPAGLNLSKPDPPNSTVAKLDHSSRGVTDGALSTPNSVISTTTASYGDGGGPERTTEDQCAALRVSTMPEAIEACRERGLSNDERLHMFEALKKSLPPTPATKDSSATYEMYPVFESDEEATQSDMEFVDRLMARCEISSKEDSEEGSEKEI